MATFSLPDIYLAAEQAKSAQQQRKANEFQIDRAEVDAQRQDLIVLGRFADQLLQSQDPVQAYNSALPTLQKAVMTPDVRARLNPTSNRDEILSEARQLSQIAKAIADPSGQGLPAGFVEFQQTAGAAGLQPGTPEYEQAARVRLGLEGRASNAGWQTYKAMGRDGREYVISHNPRTGENIVHGGDEFVSPTELESAQNTALGSGRGRAQADQEANAPKREESRRQLEATIDSVMVEVDTALENTAWTTSGFFGSRLANVEGSPAYNLKATLDTIKANLGFDKLQAMREASPTGGALGAVSERELTLLTSAIASLDQAQSDDQLRAALQKIKRHYENWKEIVQEARANDPYAPKQESAETADPLGIR